MANSKRKAAPHTKIMGAVTKSLSDGRMKDFMENPSEETRDAIVKQVHRNLTALMKGGAKFTSSPKSEKTEKTTRKPGRPRKVENEKVARVARKVRVNADVEKAQRIVTKRATEAHSRVLRVKENSDAGTISAKVEKLLRKFGLNVASVRASGTANVETKVGIFNVKFNKAAPVVTFAG